jgi:uncharacterized Fe-S cluster-containing MiaB family protein
LAALKEKMSPVFIGEVKSHFMSLPKYTAEKETITEERAVIKKAVIKINAISLLTIRGPATATELIYFKNAYEAPKIIKTIFIPINIKIAALKSSLNFKEFTRFTNERTEIFIR